MITVSMLANKPDPNPLENLNILKLKIRNTRANRADKLKATSKAV